MLFYVFNPLLFYLEEKKADACPHKNRCGDVRPGSTALDSARHLFNFERRKSSTIDYTVPTQSEINK